ADDDTVPLALNDTDFGAVEVGAPAVVHTFTVRSTGTLPLTISSVAVSGTNAADFTVNNAPTTVPTGTTKTFTVSFHPAAAGVSTARLSISSNDTDEATYDFALGGTALAPQAVLNVATTSLDISLPAGATSSAAIAISNSGAGALNYAA